MEQNNLDVQKIKESFDPKLISALFKNFSNPYVALFELLDNAVDDQVEGKTLTVSITYSEEDNKMIIKNINGKGMNLTDLNNFFAWGHSEKTTGRIGRYGQGGKAALGYLAKGFSIKSHPINSEEGFYIKVTDWEDRESGFKEGFHVEKFQSIRNRDEGDVSIEIFNLKRELSSKTIVDRIIKTYRPLINSRKIDFYVNDTVRIECPIINYDEGTKKSFNIPFNIGDNNYTITGEYGLVSDTKSDRGGFKIYQYGRNVAEKEYFGHTDPSKRWNVERLYGELYVNFDLPLLMNKTEVDKDSELWQTICNRMYDEIETTIKEAKDYRSPDKTEKRAISRISKKVKKQEGGGHIDFELTNYGPNLLFKVVKDKDNKVIIKINREHKAYKKWSSTAYGKELYNVMVYSLYSAAQKLSKNEASKFLNSFSESLRQHTDELYNQ